ncbi:MAG: glutathione S-transferase family protein [Methyloceanibacter sp.]
MMKLYGSGPTRSLRVLWALQELDAEFEFVSVDVLAGEIRHPDFLRLNPAGKIPVLVDGDLVLTESAAIVMYLAEKYGAKGLMPADLTERAQVYRWSMFAVTELEQPLWRIARHTFVYPEDKRLPEDIALAREEFVAAILDRHMDGREFIVGDNITIADCVTAYVLDWGDENGLSDGRPNLKAYLERMYARPKAAAADRRSPRKPPACCLMGMFGAPASPQRNVGALNGPAGILTVAFGRHILHARSLPDRPHTTRPLQWPDLAERRLRLDRLCSNGADRLSSPVRGRSDPNGIGRNTVSK